MRLPRFYHPEKLARQGEYRLSDIACQHARKVLRLATGDKIILFDGEGNEAGSVIGEYDGRGCPVLITEEVKHHSLPPVQVHLAIAVGKGDRMDYAVQKSVETGVMSITPLITSRTIVKLDSKREANRRQHWQGIIIHACEQSGRTYLPQLNPVTALDDWISKYPSPLRIAFDSTADKTLGDLTPAQDVAVAIGPEGGFSESELERLGQGGIQLVRLGPRILRNETAAVAACAAIQTLWGDYLL